MHIWPSLGTVHFVGSDPTSLIELRLNPFSSNLINQVRKSNPQKTDWNGVVSAGLVVDREFNFVSLVHVKLMLLVCPSIRLGGFRPAFERVFDFHNDECIRSTGESTRRGMIHVCYAVNSDRQVSSKRLSLTRRVQAIIVARIRSILYIDVKVFISSECSREQLDLLSTLHASQLSLTLALAIAFHLVELDHFINAVLVLLLHTKFELEL